MNSWLSAVALWVADYYLLATLLLFLTWAAMRFVRQPVHRLTMAWVTMAGLAVLGTICSLPMWPRFQIVSILPDRPVPEISTLASVEVPAARSPRSREEIPDRMMSSPTTERELPYEDAESDHRTSAGLGYVYLAPSEESEAKPIEPGPAEAAPALGVAVESSWSFKRWCKIVGASFSAGVVLIGLWLLWGAVQTALLCRRASEAPESIRAELSRIIGKDNKNPRLLLSPGLNNAVVLGILRPTIILPSAVIEEGASAGTKAALTHEWAHVKNGDLWLLAASRCLLLLLFAHPLFWWLRRRIRFDQETVADAVAASDMSREDYSQGLVAWARISLGSPARRIPAALAIWEGRSRLEKRIAVLLDESVQIRTSSSRYWKYASLAVAGPIVVSLSVLTVNPTSSAVADSAETSQATVRDDPREPEEDPVESNREELDGRAESDEEKVAAALRQLGASVQEDGTGTGTNVFLRNAEVGEEEISLLKGLSTLKLESESGVLTVRCLDPGVRVMIEQGRPRSEELILERDEHVVKLNWSGFRIELGTELSPTNLWLTDCYASPNPEKLELARAEQARELIERMIVNLRTQEESPKMNSVLSVLEDERDHRTEEVKRLRENLRELAMRHLREHPERSIDPFKSGTRIDLEFAARDIAREERVLLLITTRKTELEVELEVEANPAKMKQLIEILEAEIDRRRREVETLRDNFQKRIREEIGLTATSAEDGLIRVTRKGKVVAEVTLSEAGPTD